MAWSRPRLLSVLRKFPVERRMFHEQSVAFQEGPEIEETVNTVFHSAGPFFARLITEGLEERHYYAGDVLMTQGETGDETFLVHRGSCEVRVNGKPVATVHQGAILGEVNLIGVLAKRGATVICEKNCRILVLDKREFQKAMDWFPKSGEAMRRLAFKRIQENMAAKIWKTDDNK